jgi:sterol desaturase/sphingolipid hydroxylase (fatty acid hydroxylase superfamily)
MEMWLVKYQVYIRLGVFAFFFVFLALWEAKRAAWPWLISRRTRWQRHIALSLLSKVIIRIIFPFLAVTTAFIAQNKGIGYFNKNPLPLWLEIICSMMFLDLVMYLQHRMMHRLSLFWRVHRVHHIDRHLDLSTGLRFHPIEEILTMGFKLLAVSFMGAPVVAVLFYEILLNAMTMFVHMNIHLSSKTDRLLRWLIITPNMHRIHHSDYLKETNSNYGFILSFWDRLFGSYTPMSITGEFKISIGLEDFRDPKFQTFENMLLVPFNLKRLKVRHKKRLPSRIA